MFESNIQDNKDWNTDKNATVWYEVYVWEQHPG